MFFSLLRLVGISGLLCSVVAAGHKKNSSPSSSSSLDAIKTEGIVPDVIDTVPNSPINITYENNIQVNFGNMISRSQAMNFPTNLQWESNPDKFYTLAMIDPDAPSRKAPIFGEYLHWMVVNIEGGGGADAGDSKKDENIYNGTVLATYRPPGPPQGSGLHRYVFLMYEQPSSGGKVSFNETADTFITRESRARFSVRKFAKKYNFGEPIAANFFQAEFDHLIPVQIRRSDE